MTERNIFLTTIEDDPGRVHIAMFEGHGVDQVSMRKDLTLFEMLDMHQKLTKALWERVKGFSASGE